MAKSHFFKGIPKKMAQELYRLRFWGDIVASHASVRSTTSNAQSKIRAVSNNKVMIKSCVTERGTAATACSLRFLAEKGKSGSLGSNVLFGPG